jgi:hypothetical protein
MPCVKGLHSSYSLKFRELLYSVLCVKSPIIPFRQYGTSYPAFIGSFCGCIRTIQVPGYITSS